MAKKEFAEANHVSTRDLFQNKIKPEAQRLSPRSDELKPGQEKHNADTITVRVRRTKKGPRATMFTQSDHGGYLEHGTRHQAAQPYMYPAFIKYAGTLFGIIKQKVNTIAPKLRKK